MIFEITHLIGMFLEGLNSNKKISRPEEKYASFFCISQLI